MNLENLKGKRFKEWWNWLLRTQQPAVILKVMQRLFPKWYFSLADAQAIQKRKELIHKLAKRRDLNKLSLSDAQNHLKFKAKNVRFYRLLLVYSHDRFPDNKLRRACRRWLKEWKNEANK